MNKEKQIEEMASEIQKAVDGCASFWSRLIAEHLYNVGYRKASDVAEEIFAEIERAFFKYYDSAVTYSSPNLPYHLREAVGFSLNEMFMEVIELKKKYTEEVK